MHLTINRIWKIPLVSVHRLRLGECQRCHRNPMRVICSASRRVRSQHDLSRQGPPQFNDIHRHAHRRILLVSQQIKKMVLKQLQLPFDFNLFHYVRGILSDIYGRKYMLMAALIVNGAFGILCGLSQTFTWLLIFRLISGIG